MRIQKKEDVCEFLQSIRKMNPDADLVIILDNIRSHHADKTREYAEQNRIDLVFLPPYSPDLNPLSSSGKASTGSSHGRLYKISTI